MKKLLIGVVLVSMVLALSSCATMSDETFADITQTWVAKTVQWAFASAFDPEAQAKVEGLLTEACKEHGCTVAAYKRKAKALGKKLDELGIEP
ncbi:MAG: hypothetical protein E3J71_04795 [Candidatus Stahlbacteria bacterium]|nr:MAG: hypothetical protein E3J71_04795 [Candidatus Stahlbacteria bacterium]